MLWAESRVAAVESGGAVRRRGLGLATRWGVVSVAGRRVKGWQVGSVGILLVALAVGGCGVGSGSGASGQPASATTAAAHSTSTPGTSARIQVVATVKGRTLVGQCMGLKADAPTVLLEVGMGAPWQAFGVVEQHLAPRTRVCLL